MADPITLMAAGELRTALEATTRGDHATAAAALMSIDPTSWQAIEHRLTVLGGSLPELLASIGGEAA